MMGLVAVLVAILVGGIPFGLIIVRLKTGKDVRDSGSGNIGATNVELTAEDLAAIDQASAGINIVGARYPAFHEKLVGR